MEVEPTSLLDDIVVLDEYFRMENDVIERTLDFLKNAD